MQKHKSAVTGVATGAVVGTFPLSATAMTVATFGTGAIDRKRHFSKVVKYGILFPHMDGVFDHIKQI